VRAVGGSGGHYALSHRIIYRRVSLVGTRKPNRDALLPSAIETLPPGSM
jgi:hypothetical protein